MNADGEALYQRVFYGLATYGFMVDYEQLPERLETYSEFDRRRIQRRMTAIQTAVEQGRSLDDGPFEVNDE